MDAAPKDHTYVGQVNDLEEILFNEGAIEARIRQIAGQIDKDYQGKTVTLIGILKGSGKRAFRVHERNTRNSWV